MSGANLVIPAQICDELLCRQVKFMAGWTDGWPAGRGSDTNPGAEEAEG